MKKFFLSLFLPILLAFSFTSVNSYAAEKKGEGALSNPLSVEVQGIVVPIVNGKRLVNYAFMTIVIYVADDKSANLIRSNQFLVKDAIIRATSKSPIPVANPSSSFNGAAFGKSMIGVIMGAIQGVRVTKIEVLDPQMMRR